MQRDAAAYGTQRRFVHALPLVANEGVEVHLVMRAEHPQRVVRLDASAGVERIGDGLGEEQNAHRVATCFGSGLLPHQLLDERGGLRGTLTLHPGLHLLSQCLPVTSRRSELL